MKLNGKYEYLCGAPGCCGARKYLSHFKWILICELLTTVKTSFSMQSTSIGKVSCPHCCVRIPSAIVSTNFGGPNHNLCPVSMHAIQNMIFMVRVGIKPHMPILVLSAFATDDFFIAKKQILVTFNLTPVKFWKQLACF